MDSNNTSSFCLLGAFYVTCPLLDTLYVPYSMTHGSYIQFIHGETKTQRGLVMSKGHNQGYSVSYDTYFHILH